jgi:hypothetical protein
LQLVCFQALIQTYAFRCVRFPRENEHSGNGSSISNSREKKIPKKISHFFWKFFRELSFFEHENFGRFGREKALLSKLL